MNVADNDENVRCAEKACPWPALPGQGVCALHVLESADPRAFRSAQPSGTLEAYSILTQFEMGE
jgi:hypothetical protein